MLAFLSDTQWRNKLKDRIQRVDAVIRKAQRKRRLVNMIYNTKMQILYRLWNRELLHISKGALKGKDKKSKQLLSELNSIREDVKDTLLRTYLFRCTVKHSMAFFQWRARFSSFSTVIHIFTLTLNRKKN